MVSTEMRGSIFFERYLEIQNSSGHTVGNKNRNPIIPILLRGTPSSIREPVTSMILETKTVPFLLRSVFLGMFTATVLLQMPAWAHLLLRSRPPLDTSMSLYSLSSGSCICRILDNLDSSIRNLATVSISQSSSRLEFPLTLYSFSRSLAIAVSGSAPSSSNRADISSSVRPFVSGNCQRTGSPAAGTMIKVR